MNFPGRGVLALCVGLVGVVALVGCTTVDDGAREGQYGTEGADDTAGRADSPVSGELDCADGVDDDGDGATDCDDDDCVGDAACG